MKSLKCLQWVFLKQFNQIGIAIGCTLSLLFVSCRPAPVQTKFKVGFSQCTAGDAWRKAMHEEMKRELAFHPEIDFFLKDAKNSSEQQIRDIEALIELGVDLMIVSPNESDPITPVVEALFQQGIPVIILDRRTNSSFYSSYVGADNYEIGKTAGQYLAKLLGGEGEIMEIWGLPGSSPAQNRHDGFLTSISQFPGLRITTQVEGKWQMEIARQTIPRFLSAENPPDAIFSHNDAMAMAAFEVAKELGIEEQIKFIGVDGLAGPNGGVQFVENGQLDATLLYPTGGKQAIQLAIKILEKEPFEKENVLQSTIIDSTNVRIMKLQADQLFSQQKDIERQRAKIDELSLFSQNQTHVLYIVLVILVLALVLGAWLLLLVREKQEINRSLELKHQETLDQRNQIIEMSQKTRQANEARIQFFTNISHEFRTPLTLLLGPTEDLLKQAKNDSEQKKDLLHIRSNAVRLLRLVNQLMDLRKIDQKQMKLKAQEQDLVEFVSDIYEAFWKMANQRKIDFQFRHEVSSLMAYFDPNMLDKVLFNLLSNAFKFTQDRGSITLKLEESESEILIHIQDNGRGMSPEQVEHAFDRYYQGDTYRTIGTGLGLALSKDLMQLHRGNIAVVSEKGVGTQFTLSLPKGRAHLEKDEIHLNPHDDRLSYEEYHIFLTDSTPVKPPEPLSLQGPEGQATILLIEDHYELRNFIKDKLGEEYQIIEADNGKNGLEMAQNTMPDLIISDISLPHIQGTEIVRRMKSELNTSHIPIILLTAKNSPKEQVLGLQTGADAYLTKPFHLSVLREQIHTLLKNRDLLRSYYLQGTTMEVPTALPSQLDRKFLHEFTSLIEKRLGDSDFGVEEMCQTMGLSRVQLYRKTKALLNCGVSDYIKQSRLNKARQLLLHTSLSISEIAYEVGFSSPLISQPPSKTDIKYLPRPSKAKRTWKQNKKIRKRNRNRTNSFAPASGNNILAISGLSKKYLLIQKKKDLKCN